MPRLWEETITSHRHAVGERILDTVERLVSERGLRALTMSGLAQECGIGRATLYKYFPDLESVLAAWHGRKVQAHLEELTRLGEGAGGPLDRLGLVLAGFARAQRGRGAAAAAALHQGGHILEAEQRVAGLVGGLLSEAAQAGQIRTDVALDELTSYCLHALGAAGAGASEEAMARLVAVTMDGLRAAPG